MYRQEKEITWLGDSLEALPGFPASVRVALGSDLRRLQIGEPAAGFQAGEDRWAGGS